VRSLPLYRTTPETSDFGAISLLRLPLSIRRQDK
jgi:hypothetical protein